MKETYRWITKKKGIVKDSSKGVQMWIGEFCFERKKEAYLEHPLEYN